MSRPVVGEPAPSVSLIDSAGTPWRLVDQHGRNIVLIFHRHIH